MVTLELAWNMMVIACSEENNSNPVVIAAGIIETLTNRTCFTSSSQPHSRFLSEFVTTVIYFCTRDQDSVSLQDLCLRPCGPPSGGPPGNMSRSMTTENPFCRSLSANP